MKKLIYIVLVLTAMISCTKYEDFIADYDHTAVYFPYQELTRSFVYGEKHSIELAVSFGGRRQNSAKEWANYVIEDALIESSMLIRDKFYSLSDESNFTIPAGKFFGVIEMGVTEEFFDSAQYSTYKLPLRIKSTSLDSILEGKDYMILTLNIEAKQFGNYYHNGVTVAKQGNEVKYTSVYHEEEPVTSEAGNWELKTVTKNTLVTNGISDKKGVWDKFLLSVDTDNQVSIVPATGASFEVTQDGKCSYDAENRKFYLKYKYIDGNGYNCSATDTLIFRNRMLDGVNQWDL